MNKIEYFKTESTRMQTETEELQGKIAEKKQGKDETEERKELDQTILQLKAELDSVEKELAVFHRNDPKRLDEISKSAVWPRTLNWRP
jgi:chromosome segregation ATPase